MATQITLQIDDNSAAALQSYIAAQGTIVVDNQVVPLYATIADYLALVVARHCRIIQAAYPNAAALAVQQTIENLQSEAVVVTVL